MPAFDLDEIKVAAKAGHLRYSRAVFNQTANLGYERVDVIQCICALTKDQFRKTHNYEDGACDDYETRFTKAGNDCIDDIYIKFKLIGNPPEILLVAFHQPRAI